MEIDQSASVRPAMASGQQPWEYSLRKYLLLLATIVATVTYGTGFNPPGGIWQEGAGQSQLAGDPIIRDTHYHRYLAFFYCNAMAFAASLVVIVLILILAVRHDKEKEKKGAVWVLKDVVLLRAFMLLDLLSLMGAYGAGTCRDKVSTVYSTVLVAAVFLYIAVLKLWDWWFPDNNSGSDSSGVMPTTNPSPASCAMLVHDSGSGGVMPTTNPSPGSGTMPRPIPDSGSGGMIRTTNSSLCSGEMPEPVPDSDSVPRVKEKEALKKLKAEERLRKVLMLLATFAVSITYVAGLSTPGGFWDSTRPRHRPGDAILKDRHNPRLVVFLLCNTTSFVASLLITMLLIIDRKLREKAARSLVLYGCIFVALVGLVVAYTAGSCRKIDTTIYVGSLVGVVLAYILLHISFYTSASNSRLCSCPSLFVSFSAWLASFWQAGDNAR